MYFETKKKFKKTGFTLIEMLIVIGIMGFLAVALFVTFNFFQGAKTVDAAADEIMQTLRLAQSKTLSSEGDSSFGVYFESDKFTLFRGIVFDPSAPDNETHVLNKVLIISAINLGASSIVFDRLTGTVPVSGSLTVELVADAGVNKTIFIDTSGTISSSSDVPSDIARIKDSRHVHVLYSENTKNVAKLVLFFPSDGVTQNIDYQAGLNSDKSQFFWQGTITVGGLPQVLEIHTHELNDAATLFCIHRDRRFNSKALNISLDGQNLINYTDDGITTQDFSFWVGPPQLQ